jgi:uncharacterized protein YkwD
MVSLQFKSVGILAISLIAAGIFIWSLPTLLLHTWNETTPIETEIFDLINEERANRGLPALQSDDALTRVALEWSAHLAEIDDLIHGDFAGRMARIGYSQHQCHEIIALYKGSTQNLARQIVDMWLGSPEHYHSMMTPKRGCMGVGVSESQGFFAVVDFRFTDS